MSILSADRLRVPGELRVFRAHVTLELGKLTHELGRLVGLREPCRLERRLAAAERLDELLEPLCLVGERPCALEERNRAQPLRERVDPDLDVALEREGRVFEAAADDVLDPAADRVRVPPVGDEREAVASEREGADVVLDRRLDDAARQLEVRLVEAAVEDDRRLDEVHDLGQDAVRVGPLPEPVERPDDLRPALLAVGLDARRPQSLRIPGRVGDLDRPGREAVTVRTLTDDPRRVQHREAPPHRPGEARAALVPAHRLREGEAPHELVHLGGHDLGERLPGHRHAEEAVALLELVHGDAVSLREARRGLVPHRDGRPLHPLVGRLLRDVVHEHRQPARCDEDPTRLDSEHPPDEQWKLTLRLAARGRGQLLTADLNQERRHRLPRTAGQSGARACGRARCRRRARSPTRRRARRAG